MFGKKKDTPKTEMPRLDVSVRRDVKLGQTATDIVTGFTGIVNCMSHEIDGTLLVGVQPCKLDGEKPAEAYEFDIERLRIGGEPAILPDSNTVRPTITLGAKYRDKITGFEGYAIRVIDFLGGCTRISLSQEVDKDGKLVDAAHFPIERVEMVDTGKSETVTPKPTGGPGDGQRSVSRASRY